MKELTIDAKTELYEDVISFVDEELERADCPMLTQLSINVCVEELFVNIASYAYKEDGGKATIKVSIGDDLRSAEITFIDSGIKYDPLAKTDPDIDLPIEDRPIGGLGIFIVKQSMDDVRYEYTDGCNILTMKKSWE